jgi:hypothetical protein
MGKIEITEEIIIILKRRSVPFSELYANYFETQIRKSEFATCIRDLMTEKFIDYIGNFDDPVDIVLTRFGEEMIEKYINFSTYLKSKSNETLYDRTVKWCKNNIVIVSILLLLSVFTALTPFSGLLKNIYSHNTIQNDTVNKVPVSEALKAKPNKQSDTKILVSKRINQTLIKIYYELVSDKIIFHFNSNGFSPAIYVDVNQNSIADKNLDRSYGIEGGTDPNAPKLCPSYIIDGGRLTACGVAESEAILSLQENNYRFSIPVKELKLPNNSEISVQFALFNPQSGWAFYPERQQVVDFGNVFKIYLN